MAANCDAEDRQAFADVSVSRDVELVGMGSIPGNAVDLSGMTKNLEEGTPTNQLGGFSAIDFSANEKSYWVLSDRGPADGAASYPCRLQQFSIVLSEARKELKLQLQRTVLLKNEEGKSLVGSLQALPSAPMQRGVALDPEGLRVSAKGEFYISDEYGPGLDLFASNGKRRQTFNIPEAFCLTRESNLEKAKIGAMPNRGLEGLAISTDGATLVAAMQGPLIQDSKHREGKRYSNFTRLIQRPSDGSGEAKHWVYPLSDPINGISEILAMDEHRYLVLERDGELRPTAKTKAIYVIDLQQATDVSDKASLPSKKLPPKCQAVSKELIIDFLDPKWMIPTEHLLEKPEGMTWGPPLADGRRLLIVCFDNDFQSDVPSLFLAFAISTEVTSR